MGRGPGDKGCPEKVGHPRPSCLPTPTPCLGSAELEGRAEKGELEGLKSHLSQKGQESLWEEGQVTSVLESMQMCQHN